MAGHGDQIRSCALGNAEVVSMTGFLIKDPNLQALSQPLF
jgi:hypothetical protein